ncbi:protein DEHYDRATION-INDUCED 19 homolog 5 isoform X2 [Ziziphus jujuba]|uniref:Protein DEHYDRATION-INDUCED 19 homolog 5 isoform X2 n=1 Tax=Ziziphus jujuba TaxID=326968 RepID=A0A6P3ZP87_ZIZJJ|nr:protein DEHYDRATION-INDUCED 19 homolog 5 isoform X2 [Ziziphus jujuba]
MDVDFWPSKVHTARHLSAVYAARLHSDHNLAMDDSEGDDDAKTCFPCPFCYVDIEVTTLCIHLQEEHCFDLKNAVCPLCAANLGKDAIGHFMVQHASSLKHRRKSQKSGFWTSSSAALGKELSRNGRANAYDSAPDPLLSPFICSVSLQDPYSLQKNELSGSDVAVTADVKSESSSHCDEDIEEIKRKAEFVQQLIGSIIF